MELTIIVPAYNEEKRITPFLTELSAYCKKSFKDYEIVVVDDGSRDSTKSIIERFSENDKNVKLVSYPKNVGKGYAVKRGVFVAKGKNVIFIDSDGSIMPDQIPPMLMELERYDCVIGNRRDKRSKITTTKYRKLTEVVFNIIIMTLFKSKINDNLCGFKGFKKEVARELFDQLTHYGWIFDVELLYRLEKKDYSLKRIPLVWKHVGNTKWKPLDPLWVFCDSLILKRNLDREYG